MLKNRGQIKHILDDFEKQTGKRLSNLDEELEGEPPVAPKGRPKGSKDRDNRKRRISHLPRVQGR